MDIVAHTLWAGAGMTFLRRHVSVASSAVPAAIGWAALPDVVHLLPIIAWWALGAGSLEAVRAYAIPLPGELPPLPPLVASWSHHLHCTLHSALVAGAVTLLWWALRAPLGVALLGWWSHIVIDVFTHSAAFFPTPVFYPVTERGFDGIAWNSPWFLMLNYAALCIVGLWLVREHRRGHALARPGEQIKGTSAGQKEPGCAWVTGRNLCTRSRSPPEAEAEESCSI